MIYKISGSLEIRIPEEDEIVIEADSKVKAIHELLDRIVDGEASVSIVDDYLKVKRNHKVFTVYVEETFRNAVEIDTNEYPNIHDEEDAADYVGRNIDYFQSDFSYDYTTSTDDNEITCDDWDTEELEDDSDD